MFRASDGNVCVIQGFPAHLGRLDEDPEILLEPLVAHELGEGGGPEAGVEILLVCDRLGVGYPAASVSGLRPELASRFRRF